MTKVLLDTDIGTDVDDAVCLAYLLSHPDCELLGITTVTGQAGQRASLASLLCQAAGKRIPIYPGAEQPMQGEQRQPVAQQAAVLPDWPHETRFPEGQAVEFLAETVRCHPGEVTLLTVGPLTNIGKLFSTYPEVATLLRGLVIMGGSFGQVGQVETNIASDPLASEIVYETAVRLHRSLGLNVTRKVVLPADAVRERFTAPLLRPVLDMAEIWFAGFYPRITFHDPLAAATVFEPDLCTYQPGTVTIERIEARARTSWQPGGFNAPHQAAIEVAANRYFEHFFRIVGGGD